MSVQAQMDSPPAIVPDAETVSIVVPTFREADNLAELAIRIELAMQPLGIALEIIVVDDDSQDATAAVVGQLQAAGHPIRLIVRHGERGLSSAVLRGFAEAKGTLLVCMDADLSHPPEALPDLLNPLREGKAEFVIGSRYVRGASTDADWGTFRRLNSRVATLLARPFTSLRDPLAGFFALRRSVLQSCPHLDPIGYKIGLELIVKSGCNSVCEIPIHFADRQRGESKMNLAEQIRYLRHLHRLADFKFHTLWQFTRFCLVGASGMVCDLSIYALLMKLGVSAAPARAAAIWMAINWNFALNRIVTFYHVRLSSVTRRYFRFLLGCALGAAVSWTIAVFTPRVITPLDDQLFPCAVAGIVAGTLINYTLSRFWAFRGEGERR